MRSGWLKILGSVAVLIGPTFASASAPAVWYRGVTVQYIYSGAVGGRVSFKVNSSINVGTCNATSEFELDQDSPYFWTIYTLVISAQRTGSAINVFTDGTCSTYGVFAKDVALGNLP